MGSPAELSTTGGIYAQLLKLTSSASAADRARLKKYGFSHESESADESIDEDEVVED